MGGIGLWAISRGRRPLAAGGRSRRRDGLVLSRMSGMRLGICVTLTHVRSLAFGGGRGTWGKIGLFGRWLHLLECRRDGAALCRNGGPWRTSGCVLGLHRLVVGAAVDLADSGCVVGMVALRATWRCVTRGGAALRQCRGGRRLAMFATLAIAVRARLLRCSGLLLRCGFCRGPQRWLRVDGRLRSGVDSVWVGDLTGNLVWNLAGDLGWDLVWDVAGNLGRGRLLSCLCSATHL
jgi:hypothetical protein